MGSEWPRVQIDEVCELIVDCVNKTAPTVDVPTPYKMIRTPNVKGGRVSTENCKFVDKETFNRWTRRARVKFNDVLLTREAPLGEVGIVKTHENIFLGQRLMQYRVNSELLDPDFLLYSFLSQDLQHQFHMHEGSGSVVSHIRVGDCSKFELNLPPLKVQNKITGILRPIDDKIELNKKINQTLEQMAQAMFKSWFVDFDPVFDNLLEEHSNNLEKASAYLTKKGAEDLIPKLQQRHQIQQTSDYKPLPDQIKKEFPSDFQHHEDMGWIPEGWATGNLHDIAELTNERVDVCDLTINNYISTENMLEGKKGVTEATSLPSVKTVPSFRVGQILVSNIRPYFKKIWLATFDGGRSGDVLGFTSKGIVTKEYLYNFLYQDSFFDFMMLTSKGAKMPRGDKVAIMDLNIIIPTDILTHHYSKLVKDNHLLANNSLYENKTLQNIREILLPELISGNLKVG